MSLASQYHQGETLWPQLATGQPPQLVREADNRYDNRAVRVDWQGHKLGYIPGWIMCRFAIAGSHGKVG